MQPGSTRMRAGKNYALKSLPNTKEEIEMTGPLGSELGLRGDVVHRIGNCLKTGKCRRIQIVSEIQANRADGCLVMHSHTDRVRNVVEIALGVGVLVHAEVGIFLTPA